MTPTEKAIETRKRHSDAREAKYREENEVRDKMKRACIKVLDDSSASPSDITKALEILHDLTERRWHRG